MTRYTVVWHDAAQGQLARIWVDAEDRQAVAFAANLIDAQLAVDSDTVGVAIEEGIRQLVVPPLSVLFAVSEPDRLAKIVHVEAS